ncbi:MAG TPA: BNR-repeat neuraminidase N-terminal domain-containing protein, partial [Tenuifilaceae bacterium]|nr:BNR-repeat neuraminidase N-terminal domain-containing protein [Tenuifilaceae bacterium]
MKRIAIILAICLAASMFAKSQEVFLYEGFESGSIPAGWIDEPISGSVNWRYENGGYASGTVRHPASAYADTVNALFQFQTIGPETQLITPPIDLRTAIKAELSFWHAQDKWAGTDELKVLYRPSQNEAWVLIEHYTSTIKNWTQHIFILPDEAKTQTCQIAFRAKSNWGYGVCIDEVKIEEKGVLPRQIESFSVKQSSTFIPSGSEVNPLGYFNAFVIGNDGLLPINSIVADYSGTDITDITGIQLFYTRDTIFNVSTQIPSNYSVEGTQITIEAPSFSLQTGENYIWITANVSSSANHSNTIDFTHAANSIDIGGNLFPSINLSPTGFNTIEESILYDGFESALWTMNGDWETGVPTGIGTDDPTFPYSGSSVLATKLDTNYTSEILVGNPHNAISPNVNAKYYKDVKIRYKRWLNIDYFDKTSVKYSVDEGNTWITAMQNTNSITDRSWKSIRHGISPQATRKSNLRVKFSLDETDDNTEYG